jgi:hypothetical protein
MPFTYTITRDSTVESVNPLVVNLTVSGTATFGVDYTQTGADSFTTTSATVTIPANSLSKDIVITPVADAIFESDETIILTILPTFGASQIGSNPSATATITNDDVNNLANVVLLLPLTTAAGIADITGKAVTNLGTTASTAINDPFGNNTGVRAFGGGGAALSVAQSADFAFGNGAFAIEFWVYPTAFPSGTGWGLLDARSAALDIDYSTYASSSNGAVSFKENAIDMGLAGSPTLVLNQWRYLCISRDTTGNTKLWIGGLLANTAPSRNTNTQASGNLLIGDLLNNIAPFAGSLTGYLSNFRITRAYRDGSIVPTAPFPTA